MATLEISGKTIDFNNKILNLRTVTSVYKLHRRTARPFKMKAFFWTLVLFGISCVLAGQRESQGIGLLGIVITGGFFIIAVYRNTRPRDFWILCVETAAGTNDLIATRDQHAVDNAVRSIRAALESDITYHSSVNISDSTIVNNSNIRDSDISNNVRRS